MVYWICGVYGFNGIYGFTKIKLKDECQHNSIMEASLQQYLSAVKLDMFDATDMVNVLGSVISPDATLLQFPRCAAKWLMKRNQHVIESALSAIIEKTMVPYIDTIFNNRVHELSMASKYFYVFKLSSSNIYKIGMSGNIQNRLSTLQTSREENIVEVGSVHSNAADIKRVESAWKGTLSKLGLHGTGGTEVFDFSQFTDVYYKERGVTPDIIAANIIRLTQETYCQSHLISNITFSELVGCQPKPKVVNDKEIQLQTIEVLQATLKRKTMQNANLKRKNTKLMKLDGKNIMGQSGNRYADNNVQQWREQMDEPVETETRRQRNAATADIAKRLRQNKAFYEKYRCGSWYNVTKFYKDLGVSVGTCSNWCTNNPNLSRRCDIDDSEFDDYHTNIYVFTYMAKLADFAMLMCNLAPRYKKPGSVLMTQVQLTTKDMDIPLLFVTAFQRVYMK
jgi:hypothetical protein